MGLLELQVAVLFFFGLAPFLVLLVAPDVYHGFPGYCLTS